MTQAAMIEGTTQHARLWSATAQTPDLMTVFTDAIDAVREGTALPSVRAGDASEVDAAVGFRAVFEWAMRQDFPPDHAARMRREAWGHDEPQ